MRLGRRRTTQQTEVSAAPRGFEGRMQTFAPVVHAALLRAGYHPLYLSGRTRSPGELTIGTDGTNIGVSMYPDPPGFTWDEAQQLARKLNAVLQGASRSARGLASAHRGATHTLSMSYVDVIVRCPNDSTLRALRNALVR